MLCLGICSKLVSTDSNKFYCLLILSIHSGFFMFLKQ